MWKKKTIIIIISFIYLFIYLFKTVRVVAGCDNDGFQNGAYNLAKFNNLNGIVLPNDTSLYISDTNNNCIRTVNNGGMMTHIFIAAF